MSPSLILKGGNKDEVQTLLNDLSSHSKIPLLIAASCDAGGHGACNDGTYIASVAQCEATQQTQVAFNACFVSGKKAKALGVNVTFDPGVIPL